MVYLQFYTDENVITYEWYEALALHCFSLLLIFRIRECITHARTAHRHTSTHKPRHYRRLKVLLENLSDQLIATRKTRFCELQNSQWRGCASTLDETAGSNFKERAIITATLIPYPDQVDYRILWNTRYRRDSCVQVLEHCNRPLPMKVRAIITGSCDNQLGARLIKLFRLI